MADSRKAPARYGEWEVVEPREKGPRFLGLEKFGRRFHAISRSVVDGREVRKYAVLRVFPPGLVPDTEQRDLLIRELLVLAKATHPNVVEYLGAGQASEGVYYVTELCGGGDLSQMVQRFGALPPRVVALIGLQVLTGLEAVHSHRLIHRDLKPSGIVLEAELPQDSNRQNLAAIFEQNDNLCRIVDFGIVNLVLNAAQTPQRFVGSPVFASPEQIREQPMDERCDIYSLGMTLWYLAQGEAPLVGASGRELRDPDEVKRRQTSAEAHGPHLPEQLGPEFREILARMIAKRPEERYADAAEARVAFQEYLVASAVRERSQGKRLAVRRLPLPLGEVYSLEEKIYTRHGCTGYAAVEQPGEKPVMVTVVGTFQETVSASEIRALSERLCRLADLSMEPACPDSVAPIREVVWAEDLLACTGAMVPQIGLLQLLKARVKARNPVRLSEAVALLYPIAEGFDYLAQGGEGAVALTCEEIWLSGETAAAAARLDPEALSAPLTEWAGLHVRFSPVPMAALLDENAGDSNSGAQGTTLGTMDVTANDTHPVPVIARLIYRILNGSEVAAAVRLAPEAYVPSVNLTAASNNMIRDLLCQRRAWLNARAVLRELCINEGIAWSARSERVVVVARVVSPLVVQSPYAPEGVTQQLAFEEWGPGEVFVCSASGRKVMLPAQLPRAKFVPPAAAKSENPRPSGRLNEAGDRAVSEAVGCGTGAGIRRPSSRARSVRALAGLLLGLLCMAGLGSWIWREMKRLSPEKSHVGSPTPAEDGFAGHRAGEVKVVAGITFHWCPPTGSGGFLMGSPESERDRSKDELQHRVILSRGFWLAETELTQGQWHDLTGETIRQQAAKILADDTLHNVGGKMQTWRDFYRVQGSDAGKIIGVDGPGMPMFWVSWEDADGYCRSVTNRKRAAAELPAGWEMRLPTEAQWEYACRAGSLEATYGGPLQLLGRNNAPVLDPIAWYGGNSGVNYRGPGWNRNNFPEKQYTFTFAGPRAVGQKRPNSWGLLDTLGNVCEWCADWYAPYDAAEVKDPEGPASGTQRVFRGGSWTTYAAVCRAARRMRAVPGTVGAGTGFRPALVHMAEKREETRR